MGRSLLEGSVSPFPTWPCPRLKLDSATNFSPIPSTSLLWEVDAKQARHFISFCVKLTVAQQDSGDTKPQSPTHNALTSWVSLYSCFSLLQALYLIAAESSPVLSSVPENKTACSVDKGLFNDMCCDFCPPGRYCCKSLKRLYEIVMGLFQEECLL